jgi:uncharacterized RDD family membrane protein YckC
MQEVQNSSPEKVNDIHLSFDDFEISEDSFKPVTKGLGFHHDQKKSSYFKNQSTPKSEVTNKTMTVQGVLNPLSTKNQNQAKNQAPKGLEAFYSNLDAEVPPPIQMKPETTDSLKLKVSETKKSEANIALQFLAYLIDVGLILTSVLAMVTLLIYISGLNAQSFLNVVGVNDALKFGASFFSIFYVLYFTILDLNSSPGKIIFGLKLMRLDGKAPSVYNTFMRSFICLISFFALGLPMLLDFQGRLSDTKVVK